MIAGSAACGITMFFSGLAYSISPESIATGKAIAAFCILHGLGYTSFSANLSWAIVGEIPSSRLRVYTTSLATVTNHIFAC